MPTTVYFMTTFIITELTDNRRSDGLEYELQISVKGDEDTGIRRDRIFERFLLPIVRQHARDYQEAKTSERSENE